MPCDNIRRPPVCSCGLGEPYPFLSSTTAGGGLSGPTAPLRVFVFTPNQEVSDLSLELDFDLS